MMYHSLFYADVCATTITEGYTPLHLVARYNPHGNQEPTTAQINRSATESTDHESATANSNTHPYIRQLSCKTSIEYLVKRVESDVSYYNDLPYIV